MINEQLKPAKVWWWGRQILIALNSMVMNHITILGVTTEIPNKLPKQRGRKQGEGPWKI